jgi:hypothetical protein
MKSDLRQVGGFLLKELFVEVPSIIFERIKNHLTFSKKHFYLLRSTRKHAILLYNDFIVNIYIQLNWE